MLRIRRRYGLGLIVIVLVLWMARRDLNRMILAQEGGPTPTPNINWVNIPEGVNVRSGPGFNYDVNGVLPVGAWVQPLARTPNGEWILVTYLTTQGWIQVTGVSWRLDTAALPVIENPGPTPIPRPLYYNTPGGPTYTPNANWVDTDTDGAYIRSGPGQGYPHLGVVLTGDVVDPVAHDQALDWVMVRFGSGYGWIRYDLVAWVEDVASLPVIDVPNLTPSFTPVPIKPTLDPNLTPSATSTALPTATPEPTLTFTSTFTATATPSSTPSATLTPTETASPTETLAPTATENPTETPTETPTVTALPSETPTPLPTSTATLEPTLTPIPTETASPTPQPTDFESAPVMVTWTPRPSATETPGVTASATAAATWTPLPSATHTPSATPSVTATLTATWTPLPSATATPVATLTPLPSATHTPSVTPSPTATPLAVATANGEAGGPGDSTPLSTLLLGGGLALAVVLYIGVYVVQSANVARYQEGFVLTICPVCQEGNLHVDDRRHRVLGVPRVRRVVRCDVCRSVLRQVGPQRWRYAVDGAENQELYEEFNGRVVTEEQLIAISPEYQGQPPEFIEGDDMP